MSYAPFPLIWGGSAGGGGGASASFVTIQTDLGTYPTASGPTDVLTYTSLDGSVVITGEALTDTVTLRANLSGTIYTQSIAVALIFG
jgi:hypothetical protein